MTRIRLTAKFWFLMAALLFVVVGFMTANVVGFVVAVVGSLVFLLAPAYWFE